MQRQRLGQDVATRLRSDSVNPGLLLITNGRQLSLKAGKLRKSGVDLRGDRRPNRILLFDKLVCLRLLDLLLEDRDPVALSLESFCFFCGNADEFRLDGLFRVLDPG